LLVKGDVSQEADEIALVQQTIAHFGRLDILINNAGVQTESPPRRSRSTALTGCWGSICGGPTCAPAKRSSTCQPKTAPAASSMFPASTKSFPGPTT
jgi:NAD(P)-dependent dehydrogenase (short-subunit alcohol dehydrogenase family)